MTSSMLLVVSGASRGFGRAVATAFCCKRNHRESGSSNSTATIRAILTARSQEGLEETKRELLATKSTSAIDSLDISTHLMDMSNLDTLDGSMDELIEAARPFSQYDRIVIVNNAGSLGHLGKVTDMSSLKDLTEAVNLNVTSGVWFTTRWARELQINTNVTIINTSSLCAVQAFPTMTTYCTDKAARNMFHESLAKESPLLKILNYAPGAMDTTMTVALREEEQLADGLKEYFRGAHAKGELVDPNTSAKKLVTLVLAGDFESGKHVDYWDLPDP